MNFKILEYIVAIAETGNVTKAAERLFISQSGLNQQLIKLETELGTPLFHRSKKEMRPTHAGRIYIENARRILKMAQNCISQINDLSDNPRGTISFGLPYEHGADLFINIAKDFSHAFPNVAITLTEQNVREMEENVQTDRLDLAFVMIKDKPSSRHFDYVHLCTERLVLGIPRKHPMAQYAAPTGKPLNTMDLKHFKNDPFAFMFSGSTMRNVIDPLFEDAGYLPKIRYETHMNNVLYRLVSNGLCCTIMPQSYVQNGSGSVWFYPEQEPSWDWYIIFSKDRMLTSADRYLIQLSQNYAQKIKDFWDHYGVGFPPALLPDTDCR